MEGAPASASAAGFANSSHAQRASCSMVNMNGVKDPFYRYTMRGLHIKAEGKGGNKKTVLCNIDTVAKDIGRPINYLVKFLGYEMKTSTSVDSHSKWSLRGDHGLEDLQKVAFKFVKDYVMCRNCGLPETSPLMETGTGGRGKSVLLACKVCCQRTSPLLADHDKFVRFMCNNPMALLSLDPIWSPMQSMWQPPAISRGIGQPQVQYVIDLALEQSSGGDVDEWAVDVSDAAVAQRASRNQVRSISINSVVISHILQLANESIESIRGRAVATSAVITDDESDVEIDGI